MKNLMKISTICLLVSGFGIYAEEKIQADGFRVQAMEKLHAIRKNFSHLPAKLQQCVTAGVSFAKDNPVKIGASVATVTLMYAYWKQQEMIHNSIHNSMKSFASWCRNAFHKNMQNVRPVKYWPFGGYRNPLS